MVRPACFRLFVLALALLAGACNPIQPTASSPPLRLQTESVAAVPSFLPTACLYRIPPDSRVSCGFLLVPEDRSRPDSRTIRLNSQRDVICSFQPVVILYRIAEGKIVEHWMQMDSVTLLQQLGVQK